MALLLEACREPEAPSEAKPQAITISILPFGDLPEAQVKAVLEGLRSVYPKVVLLKPIPLPSQAYYAPRKRYRADSLLGFLNKRTRPGYLTIALTAKDISWTKGKINDYGIMGLGLCPGSACVASSFRLSKTNTNDQLYKIAIHELGHTQGLPHCPEAGCFMRDAEGKNHTDELHGFCLSCTKHLRKKGWIL